MPVNPDDEDFSALMEKGGVKPLGRRHKKITAKKVPVASVMHDERRRQAQQSRASEFFGQGIVTDMEWLSANDTVEHRHNGLPATVFRKLKQGVYGRREQIDLHGLRVEQAEAALLDFIRRCRTQQIRSIIVIHGKGYHAAEDDAVEKNVVKKDVALKSTQKPAKLKSYVVCWLKAHRDVLAFCSAQEKEGGSGAVIVLLRRDREE